MFPPDPQPGTLFELKPGIIYKYDVSIKSWIKLATDSIPVQQASVTSPGVMKSADLEKLNRLLIPPPLSTIRGEQCPAPFITGSISLKGSDDYVGVSGQLDLKNIDQFGDRISQSFDNSIHPNTYGFDFTLDTRQLAQELLLSGKLRLAGKTGPTGATGPRGQPGISGIISGPQGRPGRSGNAPPCPLIVEPEVLRVRPVDGNKAIVNASVVLDPIDIQRYFLQLDRQLVGNPDAAAESFVVRNSKSTWVLVTPVVPDDDPNPTIQIDCGVPGERPADLPFDLYYLDVQPIVSKIHDKFLQELQLLKNGYETIVGLWVQTMSDLFDEQKRALCCAIERCTSLTKSIGLRQHMETVAATALGKAKIRLNQKDTGIEVPSTNLLQTIYSQPVCGPGATGATGPVVVVAGATGPRGPQGATGPRGQEGQVVVLSNMFIDQSGAEDNIYGRLLGSVNGINRTFFVSQGKYESGTLQVYLNGQLQTHGPNADFLETDPSVGSFTFAVAPIVDTREGSQQVSRVTAKYQIFEAPTGQAAQALMQAYNPDTRVTLDPIVNSCLKTASTLVLPPGSYLATITRADASLEGVHRSNVRFRYIKQGQFVSAGFLDKGAFKTLDDAKSAYEGLTTSFTHDGGPVEFYLPSVNTQLASGLIDISIRDMDIAAVESARSLTVMNVEDENKSWTDSRVGWIVRHSNQTFIVSKYMSDWLAWPSLDGLEFTMTSPASFIYDVAFDRAISTKIKSGDVMYQGADHLLGQILMPVYAD